MSARRSPPPQAGSFQAPLRAPQGSPPSPFLTASVRRLVPRPLVGSVAARRTTHDARPYAARRLSGRGRSAAAAANRRVSMDERRVPGVERREEGRGAPDLIAYPTLLSSRKYPIRPTPPRAVATLQRWAGLPHGR